MIMSWRTATERVLEETQTGYTLRSLDRLWMVFTIDERSEDEYRGSRLYPTSWPSGTPRFDVLSYDQYETEPVFTSRLDAQYWADRWREHERESVLDGCLRPEDVATVYVLNCGDDRRYEREVLEGVPFKARHSGSDLVVRALRERRSG